MAVTDFLERGALINPEGPCIIMGEKQFTYREMLSLVNQIANNLIREGYGLGRNAGVLADNDPIGFACTLGIMRSGMAYIPMDFRNTEEENYGLWISATVKFYSTRAVFTVRSGS